MSKLAKENNAVNLSQGFPDFNCDDELIEIVKKYMYDGNNQYAPMPGLPALKEVISSKIKDQHSVNINPDSDITITSGATQGLFTILTTFVLPGDEVIVFEPAYDSYVPTIQAMGGKAITIQLDYPDYAIKWEEFENAISPRTKMVILNNPHNPTGVVYPPKDVQRFVRLSNKFGFLLLCDEVYEHIVFDGNIHFSVLAEYYNCPNIITTFSFGKTYHTTGWKVGYIVANKALTDEIRKIHQFTVFAVNTPVQFAYAEYLQIKEKYLGLSDFYQVKRDYFLSGITDSLFQFQPAKGTYFQILDYSRISDLNDFDFAKHLVENFQVAIIPISPFQSINNTDKLIRICFAKKESTMQNGIDNLLNASRVMNG